MASFYLSIRITKTKQVYSNLFHSQYLQRYKQFNFQFYSETLINFYEKTLFLYKRYRFYFWSVESTIKNILLKFFGVLFNVVHPLD